jgi:hypothetical protein
MTTGINVKKKDLIPLLEAERNESYRGMSIDDLTKGQNVRYHQRNQEQDPEDERFCYTSTYVLTVIWSILVLSLIALVIWESSVRFQCPPVLLENFTSVNIKHHGY